LNLPNSLTLSRIFIVPLLVVVLLTKFPENWFIVSQKVIGVAIFLAAAFTDWLDGFLARRRGQVTTLGIMLDPIADKLLISAAFISLVENGLAPAWAVVIIIGREFAVTGLRNIAAAQGFTIAASRMGKFKMASQVVAITLLILGSVHGTQPVSGSALPAFKSTLIEISETGTVTSENLSVISYAAGRGMLWIVVVSAVWSMIGYFQKFYGKVRDRIEVRKRRRKLRLMKRRSKRAQLKEQRSGLAPRGAEPQHNS